MRRTPVGFSAEYKLLSILLTGKQAVLLKNAPNPGGVAPLCLFFGADTADSPPLGTIHRLVLLDELERGQNLPARCQPLFAPACLVTIDLRQADVFADHPHL